MRSFVEEYLSLVGPLLVFLVFAVSFKLRSPELAAVNIILGGYLLYREQHVRAIDQPELEEEKRELIGDKPSRWDRLAAYLLLVKRGRHSRPASHRVAGVMGVFMGALQVLEYW